VPAHRMPAGACAAAAPALPPSDSPAGWQRYCLGERQADGMAAGDPLSGAGTGEGARMAGAHAPALSILRQLSQVSALTVMSPTGRWS